MFFRQFIKSCPDYFDKLYFLAEADSVRTHSSYQKLSLPRRKTHLGIKALSNVGPSLWNNLNENLKTSSSINNFIKHKTKEYYFSKLKKIES